jgi:uncharacterized protein YlzI (FlbEa/FlbD family)
MILKLTEEDGFTVLVDTTGIRFYPYGDTETAVEVFSTGSRMIVKETIEEIEQQIKEGGYLW